MRRGPSAHQFTLLLRAWGEGDRQTPGRLAQIDSGKSQVAAVRFFGGLSLEETAAALRVSLRTVKRDWQPARACLYRQLREKQQNG